MSGQIEFYDDEADYDTCAIMHSNDSGLTTIAFFDNGQEKIRINLETMEVELKVPVPEAAEAFWRAVNAMEDWHKRTIGREPERMS